MSKTILIYFIPLFLFACNSNTGYVAGNIQNKSESSSNSDSISQNFPHRQFIELINHLDSLGYKKDTLSSKLWLNSKVRVLNYSDHFFKALFSDSLAFVGQFMETDYNLKYDSILNCVLQINRFDWIKNNVGEVKNAKGVIEEWVFPSKVGLNVLDSIMMKEKMAIGAPFGKTTAYHLINGNRIYFFYSFHSGVAYVHKEFYVLLRDKLNNCKP